MKVGELLNKRINRLTIISEGGKKWSVLAKCNCGNIKEYYVYNIINGHAKSCGCLANAVLVERLTTHGRSKDPLYRLWCDIKKRCYNKACNAYKDYGGRGIKMSDEWVNNFITFYNWALSNGYIKGLEIDRIENDGDYESSNCRFVSRIINANNKRTNRKICFNGENKTIAQLAREYNISPLALCTRLNNNWSISDALTYPVRKRGGCYNRYSLLKKQSA